MKRFWVTRGIALATASCVMALFVTWCAHRRSHAIVATEHRSALILLRTAVKVAISENLECPRGWHDVWRVLGYPDGPGAFTPQTPSRFVVDWDALCAIIENCRETGVDGVTIDDLVLKRTD